jgi:Tol biopolymer transport system component
VDPAFSPDGKFIVYARSESGAEQIFARPFRGPEGRWKVSWAGGKFPAWSQATHQLFFPRPANEEADGNLHATFLLNFFDEVRRPVPVGK